MTTASKKKSTTASKASAIKETEPSTPEAENNGQVVETTDSEPKRWKMPQPCRGQTVVFYSKATRSKRNADIAYVISLGESSIDVAYRGIRHNEVLHIDDPRLDGSNPDIRNEIGGAWDFTKETKELQAAISDLTARVEALENKS